MAVVGRGIIVRSAARGFSRLLDDDLTTLRIVRWSLSPPHQWTTFAVENGVLDFAGHRALNCLNGIFFKLNHFTSI